MNFLRLESLTCTFKVSHLWHEDRVKKMLAGCGKPGTDVNSTIFYWTAKNGNCGANFAKGVCSNFSVLGKKSTRLYSKDNSARLVVWRWSQPRKKNKTFQAWLFKIHILLSGEWSWSLCYQKNNVTLQWKAGNWGHLQSTRPSLGVGTRGVLHVLRCHTMYYTITFLFPV